MSASTPPSASFSPEPMSNKFQHRNLPMLLLRARESVMRYFRKSLKEHGLTEQQWRVIRVLNEWGEMETGRIAVESCILAPSLSGVLDRMERNGLIVRHRLAIDQRKVFVGLTDQSRDLVDHISRSIEVQYGTLEKQLGRDGLLNAYALLDQLISLPGPVEESEPRKQARIRSKRDAEKAGA